jgi:hypothetical protein
VADLLDKEAYCRKFGHPVEENVDGRCSRCGQLVPVERPRVCRRCGFVDGSTPNQKYCEAVRYGDPQGKNSHDFVDPPDDDEEYTGADAKLLKEFGLTPMCDVVLPGLQGRFVVRFRSLTEEQARAILRAARDAGALEGQGRR